MRLYRRGDLPCVAAPTGALSHPGDQSSARAMRPGELPRG